MTLVHNDGMALPLRLTALGLTAALALSGCSGGDGDNGDNGDARQPTSTSASASASETPYLDVPEGVELTDQGSELQVGDTATVAYEPRQGTVGALDIRVRGIEKATFDLFEGWELTRETRRTQPYFVRATVTNVGDTNLGRLQVPLYIVDDQNRLVEASVFTGTFKPCDGSSFPKRFRNGDTTKACLVYLAPGKGDLTAVSFRPTQEFDPITWTGEVEKAGPDRDRKRDRDRKQQRDGKDKKDRGGRR